MLCSVTPIFESVYNILSGRLFVAKAVERYFTLESFLSVTKNWKRIMKFGANGGKTNYPHNPIASTLSVTPTRRLRKVREKLFSIITLVAHLNFSIPT